MRLPRLVFYGLFMLLSACEQTGPPPSVALIAPANDTTVSGTAAVQVTLGDDTQNGEISVYARKRDSQESGRLIGTVNSSPYILSWNTTSLPAGDALELYAKATVKGATSTSTPVRVNIQNASAPTLFYLVAYNLPAGLTSQSLSQRDALHLPAGVQPNLIQDLKGIHPTALAARSPLKALAVDRQLAVEWSWKPVDGAAGYRVLFSKTSVAGPYTIMKDQAASAGTVAQERYSQYLTDQTVGDQVYGVVRSLTAAGVESAMSNAGQGVFLDAQQVASPVDGQTVLDGRPIFTWTALPGVSGYLYFLCDRPCTRADSKFVWTNYPLNMTTSLSATYPSSKNALPSGTYYWWVAGVRMQGGKAVSLSYSEQRKLVVP